MKFSWKSLVGLLLIVVSAVVGFITKTSIVVTTSIIGIVAGATLAVAEEVKKTTLVGWQKYLYLIGTIGGTVILALGGYSDAVIGQIVGAVVLILSVIFGIAVNAKKAE